MQRSSHYRSFDEFFFFPRSTLLQPVRHENTGTFVQVLSRIAYYEVGVILDNDWRKSIEGFITTVSYLTFCRNGVNEL